ncbi:Uncharacterized protein APZ42_006446 [Daphnia magna]|uniref:Uncharacterized protein n=1 Tax=Daphnia magna TaxID=35525 RepID=A0A162D3J0_9CRUS|nr:Uncharacterized protein APZ42_006446 [Daphnia magna]
MDAKDIPEDHATLPHITNGIFYVLTYIKIQVSEPVQQSVIRDQLNTGRQWRNPRTMCFVPHHASMFE